MLPSIPPNESFSFDQVKKAADEYLEKFQHEYDPENDKKHFKSEGLFKDQGIETVKDLRDNYIKVVKEMKPTIHKPLDEYIHIACNAKEKTDKEITKMIIARSEQLYITSNSLLAPESVKLDVKSTDGEILAYTKRGIQSKFNESLIQVTGYSLLVSVPQKFQIDINNPGNNRCVFIPSRYRSVFGKFDFSKTLQNRTYRPDDEYRIFSEHDDTLFLVVVDSDEFEIYRDRLADDFIVISKPPNTFGVGQSRYWCQMIAESMGLSYCWMIDDSTSSFKSYLSSNASVMDVFTLVENVVKYCKKNKEIGICGIEKTSPTQEKIVSKYVGNMVFLNIAELRQKRVYYRCELVNRKEDILFPYDCFKAGLGVCKIMHIKLWDAFGSTKPTGNHVKSLPTYNNKLHNETLKDYTNLSPQELLDQAKKCYVDNQLEKCMEILDACEEIEFRLWEVYCLKGKVLYYQKKDEESILWLTKSIEANESISKQYYYRARSYLAIGDHEKAWDDVKQGQKLCTESNSLFQEISNKIMASILKSRK